MPRPEIQILVCTNERPPDAVKPCCLRRGSLEVYHRFKDRVKELGLRNRVMVVRTGCLKHCSRGITVAVQPGNVWYAQVTPGDLDEICRRHLEEGQPIERLFAPDIPWE